MIKANSETVDGELIVYVIHHCGKEQVAKRSIVILPQLPALPKPMLSGVADKCFQDSCAFAKLQNPPASVSISVLLDGVLQDYDAGDSSIQYFSSLKTATGQHTIHIKYNYTYATKK